MPYFLTEDAVLKWLETPSLYRTSSDELYELDDESFGFLRQCSAGEGGGSIENEFVRYCLDEGLLTDRPVKVNRPLLLKSPVPSLRYLELQITDRCNLRCRHCYIGDRGPHDLPVATIRSILEEFGEMQGLRLLITGGEPLLHPAFSGVNDFLPSFAVRKVLFTNGLLITGQLLRRLHVDEIQVSIDGLEPAHDALRGKGSFAKAVDAVRKCLDAGVDVSVATMAHGKNLGDFPEMEMMFRELGIKDWTVDVPCITGRLADNPELIVPPELGGPYLRYGFGGGFHGSAPGFACGLHLMSVSAEGLASRCTFYSDRPAGNAAEGLRTCWERITPLRLDELDCDCNYLDECRGGCRYRAEALGGPRGRDLYKCYLHGIMGAKTA